MSGGPVTTTKDKTTAAGTDNTISSNKTTGGTTVDQTGSQITSGIDTSNNTGQVASAGVTNPFAPAIAPLTSMLGKAGDLVGTSGITPDQTAAISGIKNTAQSNLGFDPALESLTNDQLSGGGYGAGVSGIKSGYDTASNVLGGIANTDYSSNPQITSMLDTIRSDVNNNVGGQFAAAGRSFSGAHANALGRGLAAGEAPVMLDQYNKDRAAASGAAVDLSNVGNSTSAALDASAGNSLAARTAAPATMADRYAPYQTMLTADQLGQSIPTSNLQALGSVIDPIAGLGGSHADTGTTASQGTNTTNQNVASSSNTITTQDIMTMLNSMSNTTNAGTSKQVASTQTPIAQTALGAALGVGGILASGGAFGAPTAANASGGMLSGLFH